MAHPTWLICGTVPDPDFPLTRGVWQARCTGQESEAVVLEGDGLPSLAVQRGTPSLMACVSLAAAALNLPQPETLLVGDTGNGQGSKVLYRHLVDNLAEADGRFAGLTFHYLYPDVDGHNRVLMAVEALKSRPLLVADAGFMYVAKMSGYAAAYDVFTPDVGEMAFLADEMAPHPFYTRGFLLADDDDVPELIRRAHKHENSARTLLVKGLSDRVAQAGSIVAQVDEPVVPAMEPIGGTGDMVTGLLTAWLMAGREPVEACTLAAKASRHVGALANPTPATQVATLLPFIPQALNDIMR